MRTRMRKDAEGCSRMWKDVERCRRDVEGMEEDG